MMMTRQQSIDLIKRIVRKFPAWKDKPDHRAMLIKMIRRARSPWMGDGYELPFWPDRAATLKRTPSRKAGK